MTASFSGVKRKIIYQSGLNNTWVQLPKFWSGYIFALCGTPPSRVTIDMDEQGILTIKPDFELEGIEIAAKRQAAILLDEAAESWLRERGLWQTEIVKKCKPTKKIKEGKDEQA